MLSKKSNIMMAMGVPAVINGEELDSFDEDEDISIVTNVTFTDGGGGGNPCPPAEATTETPLAFSMNASSPLNNDHCIIPPDDDDDSHGHGIVESPKEGTKEETSNKNNSDNVDFGENQEQATTMFARMLAYVMLTMNTSGLVCKNWIDRLVCASRDLGVTLMVIFQSLWAAFVAGQQKCWSICLTLAARSKIVGSNLSTAIVAKGKVCWCAVQDKAQTTAVASKKLLQQSKIVGCDLSNVIVTNGKVCWCAVQDGAHTWTIVSKTFLHQINIALVAFGKASVRVGRVCHERSVRLGKVCWGPAKIVVAWCMALLVIAGAAWSCYVGLQMKTQSDSLSPTSDLSNLVKFEKANALQNHDLDSHNDIEKISSDTFQTYARTCCVKGESFEDVRTAVWWSLTGIPNQIRDYVVSMALRERISQKNSIQDSIVDFENSGMASTFMAFWSTAYYPYSLSHTYETCIMVTGVNFTAAETVVDWNHVPQKVQVGTRPCHCGYAYCEQCPVFHEFTTKQPIYERRSLPLKQQKELRQWMIGEAVKSAEHLVIADAEAENSQKKNGWNPISMLAWSSPSKAYATGRTEYLEKDTGGSNNERSEL